MYWSESYSSLLDWANRVFRQDITFCLGEGGGCQNHLKIVRIQTLFLHDGFPTRPGLEGEKCNSLLLRLNGQNQYNYLVAHSNYCVHDFNNFHLCGLALQYFRITVVIIKV